MSECIICKRIETERNCLDCGKLYCNKCFKEEHTKSHWSYHMSKDLKTNAIIKDRNFKQIISINDDQLPSTEDLFPGSDKSIARNVDFNTEYTSLRAGRTPLFETNTIRGYDSVSQLLSELELDDDVSLNVVTVIGKPKPNNESLTNELLMKDTSYKFPNCSDTSLLCRMACNCTDTLLILQTENMYKSVESKIDNQNNLLRLLLSLSDVIIFTQTTSEMSEDSRRCVRRDYLRIHDIMSLCKKEFEVGYSRINKKEPQKLAPGLIYLVHSDFHFNESLSESIVEATGKSALFESFSKIIRYDGEDDEMFQYGLKQMLQDLSEYRTRHSIEDIVSCISECMKSIDSSGSDPFVPCVPNKWFLCRQSCAICFAICLRPFGHTDPHDNDSPCTETDENKIYFCKICTKENRGTKDCPLAYKAKAKEENFFKSAMWYTFRGRIIECDRHGIIHDSNWLYNYYEDTLLTKCIHKWPGSNLISQNVYPMSQMVIDKVTEISKPIHKVISNSADTITDNFIIPDNWEKTTSAIECRCCKRPFTPTMSKHHCRNCKYVICTPCFNTGSSQGLCSSCVESNIQKSNVEDPTGLKIVNSVKSPLNIFTNFVKKTVTSLNRPDYWEDDSKTVHCFICSGNFDDEMRPIHHCRACGRCVCDECSQQSRPVEWRYLHEPSRICDNCIKTEHWKKVT